MAERGSGREPAWSEDDSLTFRDLSRYAVPERELQIATICDIVAPPAGPVDMVELCCGEGLLTRALLDRYPEARLLALDGSEVMLSATREAAGAQGDRLALQRFDLAETAWRRFARPPQAVVSSLAIHHLDGPDKRRLYADIAIALAPGGAFVIADLIAPAEPGAWRLAARTWDQEVRARALALDGELDAFERFRAAGWNFFSDPDPDPVDQPSPLLDQLLWLREAGLEGVDVYWMKAGHAVFGGRKPRATA